jgi:Tfp pilus assembly protein PilZ
VTRILRARYRSGEDFLHHYQDAPSGGGIFFPTREAMPLGTPVILEVRFPGLANKQLLCGFVAWRRAGKHRIKVRAGIGIELYPAEAQRRDFLLAVAKGEIADAVARRYRRLPVQLAASWRVLHERGSRVSEVEDIGPGGAFLRTTALVPRGTKVVLDVTPPGCVQSIEIAGCVAWTRDVEGEEGIGVEFTARDAGGARRLKELVRRLELLEADSAAGQETLVRRREPAGAVRPS